MIPIFQRAEQHGDRIAIDAAEGVFTYRQLLRSSAGMAACLLDGAGDLREARVAFLTPPGFPCVATQWGIWRAGGVTVPLAMSHPRPELDYVIGDSEATILVAHPDLADRVRPIAETRKLRLVLTSATMDAPEVSLPDLAPDRRAMILYTSGTTSKPKGVVTTHAHIQAQVESLVSAWEWSACDRIVHFLPLHHIHGIINVLTCALWSGARCEMLPQFDAGQVWSRILTGEITLLMAVPTIYARLIEAWEAASPQQQTAMSAACARMRLMVSGSAALPVRALERWKQISGHVLLERYGMTETGMILSNPLRGERRPGFVGIPLPGVEAKLLDEPGTEVVPGNPGEIHVRGPAVFQEYWRRPEATSKAFHDGWFRTGDIAVFENGMYRILGRDSVDIIKTGGYKVSALEIEEVLRTHPSIKECAVVGVPDREWGERVCVALVTRNGTEMTLDSLRGWAREHLAVYKVPTRVLCLSELPRNAMGKVTKPDVAKLFTPAA